MYKKLFVTAIKFGRAAKKLSTYTIYYSFENMGEELLQLFRSQKLTDAEGNEINVKCVLNLEDELRDMFRTGKIVLHICLFLRQKLRSVFKHIEFLCSFHRQGSKINVKLGPLALLEDSSVPTYRVISDLDYIAVQTKQEKYELIFCEDGISFEEVSPMQFVQYSFETGYQANISQIS